MPCEHWSEDKITPLEGTGWLTPAQQKNTTNIHNRSACHWRYPSCHQPLGRAVLKMNQLEIKVLTSGTWAKQWTVSISFSYLLPSTSAQSILGPLVYTYNIIWQLTHIETEKKLSTYQRLVRYKVQELVSCKAKELAMLYTDNQGIGLSGTWIKIKHRQCTQWKVKI